MHRLGLWAVLHWGHMVQMPSLGSHGCSAAAHSYDPLRDFVFPCRFAPDAAALAADTS